MSDDFDFDFDDDSLLADSTFLREVDNIAAQAVSQPPVQRAAPGRSASLLDTSSTASRGWTGPQRSVSSSSTFASSSKNLPLGPHRPASLSSSRSISTSRPAPARALPVSAHAPSDEFDDLPLPLPADQLSAIDSIPPRPVNRPPSIPSSRLGRTSSGSNSIGFQTHLNFRKENQTTKGKRWDRTAFAESGRRIGAVKGKKQVKGKKKRGFDDEDEEDTEDEGDSPRRSE
jgi:ATP-dependent DNA helicase MPH1